MSEIKTRAELDPALTWDLAPMYESDEAWEKEFSELDTLLQDFLKFQGHLADSPAVLKQAFEADDALSLSIERLYVYSHLKADEDTGNSANQARHDRISARSAEISGECAWFQPELLAMDESRFNAYLEDETLAFYRRTLKEIGEERKHTLSAAEERILSLSSDVLGTPHKAFSLLNDADLRFPVIEDEKGEKIEVTHGNYIKLLESPARPVRKAAFEAVYDTYSGMKNTLAALLDGEVKIHVLDAQLRSFPSAIESSLFGDKVPVSVYENLIGAIHRNLPLIYRYFALRAKVLKLGKLDMYDIHTPLLPECRLEVSWEEAVKQVCDSLQVLGPEYHSAIGQAFENRWIDVPECRGKRSGAYSSGCFGSPPYMLLNFSGTLDSMFTLAHELGHSMHSYFSDRNQPYHYAGYRIFVAEVASTVNENLMIEQLLQKESDPAERMALLAQYLENFKGTVYRQTMFAEFEMQAHRMAEQGEALNPAALNSLYLGLIRDYFGDELVIDDEVQYEWARIPHFYRPFYVYKYATGYSTATALSEGIRTEGEPAVKRYLEFLSMGGSRYPLDELKHAGVDLTTPAPVAAALEKFQRLLEDAEETAAKLGK